MSHQYNLPRDDTYLHLREHRKNKVLDRVIPRERCDEYDRDPRVKSRRFDQHGGDGSVRRRMFSSQLRPGSVTMHEEPDNDEGSQEDVEAQGK